MLIQESLERKRKELEMPQAQQLPSRQEALHIDSAPEADTSTCLVAMEK